MFIECSAGHYGRNCSSECSDNCVVRHKCNKTTGACIGGCTTEWHGEKCLLSKYANRL